MSLFQFTQSEPCTVMDMFNLSPPLARGSAWVRGYTLLSCVTVFVLISILHVFGCTCNINQRVEVIYRRAEKSTTQLNSVCEDPKVD